MTLALIRHGETEWNRELKLQGSTDIPLNDTGRGQAREAVELLAPERWDAIVSSPLSRARETAEIIASGLGITLGPTYDLLTERNYGAAEGATAEIVAARWPDRQYPGLEPLDSVVDRGTRALEQVAADFDGARTIIVCHGTLIRYTLQHLSGQTFDQILNGAISTVERHDEAWRVLSVNGEPLEVVATR
ncbi:histidine phosphatase family protein [Glaciibacter sp. 2TAF33]|uniref:histidine phosphatase family protein n=1 Tax=Glaciibacter sp. 2TAF33 TaxID=3233015 RepID=UPI003F91DFB8